MVKPKKVHETDNYYRVKFRSTKNYTVFRYPRWAKRVAESVVSGALVLVGSKDNEV